LTVRYFIEPVRRGERFYTDCRRQLAHALVGSSNLTKWQVAANGEGNSGRNYAAGLPYVLDANGFSPYSA
jgi:hypothetical protein